ncbi:TPA: hypothetical protein JD264_18325 [Serratia fonticola]|nr:hypothetical protein [Serratia fonticola]
MYNNLNALMDTVFWVDRHHENAYADLSFDRIVSELSAYNAAIDRLITSELHAVSGSRLNIYMAGDWRVSNYRSGIFSMDRVILDDALHNLSMRFTENDADDLINTVLHQDQDENLRSLRLNIRQTITFAKDNFELIRGEFILFTRSLSEEKDSQRRNGIIEFNDNKNQIYKYMPPTVATLYERSISVTNLKRLSGTNSVKNISKHELANEIQLELRDCLSSYTNGYMLNNIVDPVEAGDRRIKMKLTMGEHADKAAYERWVQDAKNRTMLFHYSHLLTNLGQAVAMKASLGTYCPFQGQILQKLDKPNEVQRRTLTVQMPFLNGLTPTELFRIRTEFEASFNAFRTVLRDTASEMEKEANPEIRDLINRRFIERMWDEGLTDIEEKLRSHKKKSVRDLAFQSVPSVLGMIVTPGISSFTTGALALLQNVFGLSQDTREVKSHPSYFLMKINGNRQ